MSFLRDMWADLVEKRLWPVAAALVIALVAVPVVLARGGGGDDPAAPAPAPAAPAPQTGAASAKGDAEVVSLAAPGKAAPAPKGAYHDPFAGAVKAQEKAQTSPSTTPSAPTTTGPPGGASTAPAPTSGGGSGAQPSTSTPSAPATPTTVTHTPSTPTNVGTKITHHASGVPAGMRVDVTWGRAGNAKRVRDLVRLGRLDGAGAPIALLFGVRADHETAVFLLPSDVSAVGDGKCLPKPSDCQLLELKAGESEFFDVSTDTGITQYELDVDKVARRTAVTATKARELRHRQSKLGRKVMFAAVGAGRSASTDFMYKSHLGVLVRQLPGR
jgi:hypothetical protein